MFIVKFFGIMDFLSALIILLAAIGLAPIRPAIGFALYLFLKGFVFKGDIASFIDMFSAFLIIIILIFGAPGILGIITVISAIYLLQKSFFSFVTI